MLFFGQIGNQIHLIELIRREFEIYVCKTAEIYIHVSNKSSSCTQDTLDLIKNIFEEL